MNKDQIKNGEVRCFPFYKGKYMGDLPFGYSNEQSAKKFMQDIPKRDVYERFGGEAEYERTHEFLYRLDTSRLHTFNPEKGNKKPWADNLCNRQFDGIYSMNQEKVFLKDLDPNTVEELKKDIKNLGFYYDWETHDKVKAFEEKYNLFPRIWIDEDDYKKMKSKIIKEEVKFRPGIIHITIEYKDEEK